LRLKIKSGITKIIASTTIYTASILYKVSNFIKACFNFPYKLTKNQIIFLFNYTLILSVVLDSSYAQKINIGGGFGGMNYKGDFAPKFDVRLYKPALSTFFRYNFSQAISARVSYLTGSIGAEDRLSNDPLLQNRNLSFKTKISEYSLIGEYNFLNYSTKARHINWTPYLFGGLAYYNFEPQARTGNYKTSQIAIPFGVGLKWEIRKPWSLEFEFGTRKLFTDYIDNLGDNVPTNQKFKTGNPSLNDVYYYSSVTLSYTFYKLVCPVY
jgi:hypothetical protein